MANTGKKRSTISKAEAMDIVLAKVRSGATVSSALQAAQRSLSWYESTRRANRDWSGAVDLARAAAANTRKQVEPEQVSSAPGSRLGDYAQFSQEFLGQHVFPHQQNMIDLMHGKEPSWLHPAMTYEAGSMGNRRVLINIPPNHAKTMTMSINYVTYRILDNPNISVLLVSKTQEMAKKLLYGVKQRLTHPRYQRMQALYGPPDGFKASADMWTQTRIYLGGDARDTGEKDPTVEALGIGGQIYGARANLILLDDTVTLSNATEYEKQDDWLRQEVASRLGPGGQILIVGTRVAPMDLYRHLRDPETYTDGHVPWTYLAMPAVLEYGHTDADTKTLWPVSDEPFVEDDAPVGTLDDGTPLYPRWTAERMGRVRNEVGPRRWSLIYQNSDVADDSTFDVLCVRGSTDNTRNPGPLEDRDGWHVLIGVDPAIAGQAGLVVYAVHRSTGKRQVLDVRSLLGPTPARLRQEIKDLVDKYDPHEVIVEVNAYQGAIVKDENLAGFLSTRGIVLRPQQTGKEKLDPDFGVASMSSLFGTRTAGAVGDPARHNKDNLISLPRPDQQQAVRLLIEELVAWNPEVPVKRRKQDLVMALWFCEIRARELVIRPGQSNSHHIRRNSFLSARDRDRQMVIDLNAWSDQMEERAVWL